MKFGCCCFTVQLQDRIILSEHLQFPQICSRPCASGWCLVFVASLKVFATELKHWARKVRGGYVARGTKCKQKTSSGKRNSCQGKRQQKTSYLCHAFLIIRLLKLLKYTQEAWCRGNTDADTSICNMPEGLGV